MTLRACSVLSAGIVMLTGCLPPWPEFITCEEVDACGSSGSTSTGDDETPPTGGVHTVTGDTVSSSSTTPDVEGTETTMEVPAEPPTIVDRVVVPDYINDNGVLNVLANTANAEGVRLLLDSGKISDLAPGLPDEFTGQIQAFSALDNGKHTAVLTPFRDGLDGASVEVDYVIALRPPAYEIDWEIDDRNGNVAAIEVLPDGRPVEFGTYKDLSEPRCYLHLRDRSGESLEFVNVLSGAYCRAIDLAIDRETGRMHVLVERQKGDDVVWWAAEIPAWGKGTKPIGTGIVGDTALALAARPDVVAVCGSRLVATSDKLDALAVLLRAGEPDEARVFDYQPSNLPNKIHKVAETARDCAFSGDNLVLVGEAWGRHANDLDYRNRLMMIEDSLVDARAPTWILGDPSQGIQTRAFALDLDDQGQYHVAGDSCADACEPSGELWTYAPGGKLVEHTTIGPLGSPWFGPHDIAWSPAGYAVVALGELQGQALVFKVQAFAPGVPLPLWSFLPNDKQGLQLALAVAVGPFGEIYAGGIGDEDHPAFARIGG